jgi:hypothetical protein
LSGYDPDEEEDEFEELQEKLAHPENLVSSYLLIPSFRTFKQGYQMGLRKESPKM